jgi:dihydroxyacetone kinase
MTKLFNDPAQFTEDMLVGFLDAHACHVTGVPGGVVRANKTAPGKVAVVIGGGSGHYPAFCGTVGPGFADGAVVGNIFTSPSAEAAASVARAAHSDAGVLLTTGNYAGDVMNFGLAVSQLESEGIEAVYFAVTDDVVSAPKGEEAKRRGIAGDFVVFKCAGAAAEDGLDLENVVRVAKAANDATRTLGVAFDGCTLPGADHPLFTVPEGRMGLGLGIHGEPGVADHPMPSAAELAATLVDGVLEDLPENASRRIAVILNGLGRTKYEELFVVWGTAAQLLRQRLRESRTRGRRARHQSRHGGLLANGDVAWRGTREVLDRTGRHPGLPQRRRCFHAGGGEAHRCRRRCRGGHTGAGRTLRRRRPALWSVRRVRRQSHRPHAGRR